MSTAFPAALPPSSLIICSRNRPQLLAETVQSILDGAQLPTEIVIVDQSDAPHPTLATGMLAPGCELRYQWTREVGIGRARNAAVAAARYELLAFTDDDVRAPAAWFGALIAALIAAGPRGAVSGQVLPAPPERSAGAAGFVPSTITDATPALYAGRVGKDVLFTNNMALRRSAIVSVGGFDQRLGPGTRFPAAEDNDLGFRLLEAGYQICYAPQASLYHRAWRSARDYLPLRWSYGRGQGAYYAKHLSLRDRYMLRRMAASITGHAMQCFWNLRRERHTAYGHAVYAAGVLSGAAQWLITQRRSRSAS